MIISAKKDDYWKIRWLDEFMIGHKGFICGGCFKNIFNNEKVKDLDIFFENELDFQEAVQYFDSQTLGYEGKDNKKEEYRFYYENPNVKAYKHLRTGVVIELCRKIFGSAYEILSKFDFTITKFAYYKKEIKDPTTEETSIEYSILMDDNFFEHLHLKRLVIDDKILFPTSTFERTYRYAKYGYFPCRDTKMKIIQAIWELNEEELGLSDSLYNGMD